MQFSDKPTGVIVNQSVGGTFVAEGPEELQDVATKSNPIEPQQNVEGDRTAIPVASMVTATETSSYRPRPCQMTIGHKFEYELTTVNDFIRRHQAINLIGVGGDITETPVGGMRANTIRTLPQNFWRFCFAGWAGTLKYRIFGQFQVTETATAARNLQTVVFHPVPGNWRQPTVLDLFGHLVWPQSTITNSTQAPGLTATYNSIGGFGFGGSRPQEVSYVTSSNGAWIDVSVPFQTQLNFLTTKTGDTFEEVVPSYSGYLTTTSVKQIGPEVPAVFQAMGDDFSYGIFRPPIGVNYTGAIIFAPAGLYNVGGWNHQIV
jgi:hypothetical protein